jgi:hypothetical protein
MQDADLLRDAQRVLERYAVVPLAPTLRAARDALEPFLFDGDLCRDDVAEICQKLDEVLK